MRSREELIQLERDNCRILTEQIQQLQEEKLRERQAFTKIKQSLENSIDVLERNVKTIPSLSFRLSKRNRN